jgi:hypothetical protein
MHECEKCKSEEMQDLLIDGFKSFFCRSCFQLVNDCDVHKNILNEFKGK